MKQKIQTALILFGTAIYFTGLGLGIRDVISSRRERDSALSQIQDSDELIKLHSLSYKLGVRYVGRTNEAFPEDLKGYVPVRDVFADPNLRQELENSLREYNSLRTNPTLAEEYFRNEEKREDAWKNSDKQAFAAGTKVVSAFLGGLALYGVAVFSPQNKKEDSKKD